MKKVIFLSFFLSFGITSQTELFSQALSAGQALLVLDELESTVNDMLNEAGNVGVRIINNAGVNILMSIESLRNMIKEGVKDLDDSLTKQQQKAFDEINSLVDKVFDNIKSSQNQLDQSLNSLGIALGNIPFSKRTPRILQTNSPLIVKNWTSSLNVCFKGMYLNNVHNYLLVNGKEIKPTKRIDNLLEFEIPMQIINSLIKQNNKYYKLNAKLVVYKKKDSKKDKHKFEYPFYIKTFPRQIVTDLDVHYFRDISTTISHQRVHRRQCTTNRAHTSGRRRSSNCPHRIDRSGPNFTIDVNSVSHTSIERRHGGDFRWDQITPVALTFVVHAQSDNRPRGGGGKHVVDIKFTEIERVSRPNTPAQKLNKKISLGSPLSFNLDTDTKDLGRIVVTFFDGTKEVLTGHRGKSKNGLIRYNYNARTKQLVINHLNVPKRNECN
jgi:hypothetical protein